MSKLLHIPVAGACLGFILFLAGWPVIAQTLPPGFSVVQLAQQLSNPTSMAFAPDSRLFITEQGGRVRIFKNGALLPGAFVQLTVDSNGERGLEGIAIDPEFDRNGYIYLYHTVPGSPSFNRVSRFTASGDDVVPNSEVIILNLAPFQSPFHNGGAMHFGVDGKLYIAVGDHASPLDAQNPDSYNGKLLRINPDGSVPDDNPFLTGSHARRLTWAMGLRNPFSFAVQPGTGRILVNDVGAATWEEINDATSPGQNFGWPQTEGYNANPNFSNPIYYYGHAEGLDGLGCAITGGTFFNPSVTNYPAEWIGKYFFIDYCGWWLNCLDLSGADPVRKPFARDISASPLALTTGPDGTLYFCARDWGKLYQIQYTNNLAPAITAQPISVSAFEGQPVQFGVSVLGATPLRYQWQFNGTDIAGAIGITYNIPSALPSSFGDYRVVVSNSKGSVISNTATLTSLGYNAPPIAQILSPANHTSYRAGTTVAFSGRATDDEDGVLPPSTFSWQLFFHHNTHRHGGPPILTGARSGTLAIPNTGETSSDVWYRLVLTVEDSKHMVGKDSIDLDPALVALLVTTSPPGLRVNIDGIPYTSPFSQSFVEGMRINIATPVEQYDDSATYAINKWTPELPTDGNIIVTTEAASYIGEFTPTSIIRSAQNGNWNNPATWSCSCVPISNSTVRVNHGVILPDRYEAMARTILYEPAGRLIFGVGSMLRLSF